MPLLLAGPTGGGSGFPRIETFLKRQFDKEGLYPRMSGMFDGSAFALRTQTVPASSKATTVITNDGGLSISAYGVDHDRRPPSLTELPARDS